MGHFRFATKSGMRQGFDVKYYYFCIKPKEIDT